MKFKAYFACASGLVLMCSVQHASAHGIAGDRVFPTTLAIDDPSVQDEISLPTFARNQNSDGSRQIDVSFELSKRITENFGISVRNTWTRLKPGGSGWQNFETNAKYRLFVNAPHEFIVSTGLTFEWGGTGARRVGADNISAATPQLYFGKGFGDLPKSLDILRPFALTGQLGFRVPTRDRKTEVTVDPDSGALNFDVNRFPKVLNWGFSLQYSLPYRNAHVQEIGGPDFLKRLIPVVEVSFQSPVDNIPIGGQRKTTGTVNPGLIYSAGSYQIAVEAVLPINRASGKNIGVIAQLHFFFDDLFPNSLGKPLFP